MSTPTSNLKRLSVALLATVGLALGGASAVMPNAGAAPLTEHCPARFTMIDSDEASYTLMDGSTLDWRKGSPDLYFSVPKGSSLRLCIEDGDVAKRYRWHAGWVDFGHVRTPKGVDGQRQPIVRAGYRLVWDAPEILPTRTVGQ